MQVLSLVVCVAIVIAAIIGGYSRIKLPFFGRIFGGGDHE